MTGPNSLVDGALPERPEDQYSPLASLIQIGPLPVPRNVAQYQLEGSRFQWIDDATMETRPTPAALIEDMIPEHSLAVIYGKPGSGKSFLALDLAYSVATGIPWLGQKVQQGPVVYIAGEGIGGLPKRTKAWKDAHGAHGGAEVYFLPDMVRLLQSDQVEKALTLLKQLNPPPVLVIVDTLARAMAGGDENSSQEMGFLIEAAERMRRELEVAVVFIHHSTKYERKGRREARGSGALEGAVDMMASVTLKEEEDLITLTCEKSKEYESFKPIRMTFERHLRSRVVVYQPSSRTSKPPLSARTARTSMLQNFDLSDKEYAVLETLGMAGEPLLSGKYEIACKKRNVSHGTYAKALIKLKARNYIRGDHQGSNVWYSLTDAGRDVLKGMSNGYPV